mgnify:CR=1 FL=1
MMNFINFILETIIKVESIKAKIDNAMMTFVLKTIIKLKFISGYISYGRYDELMKKIDEMDETV